MAVSSRLPAETSGCLPNGLTVPCLGHLRREAFPRPEDLSGKFIVQFADPLQLSDKVHIGLPLRIRSEPQLPCRATAHPSASRQRICSPATTFWRSPRRHSRWFECRWDDGAPARLAGIGGSIHRCDVVDQGHLRWRDFVDQGHLRWRSRVIRGRVSHQRADLIFHLLIALRALRCFSVSGSADRPCGCAGGVYRSICPFASSTSLTPLNSHCCHSDQTSGLRHVCDEISVLVCSLRGADVVRPMRHAPRLCDHYRRGASVGSPTSSTCDQAGPLADDNAVRLSQNLPRDLKSHNHPRPRDQQQQ